MPTLAEALLYEFLHNNTDYICDYYKASFSQVDEYVIVVDLGGATSGPLNLVDLIIRENWICARPWAAIKIANLADPACFNKLISYLNQHAIYNH